MHPHTKNILPPIMASHERTWIVLQTSLLNFFKREKIAAMLGGDIVASPKPRFAFGLDCNETVNAYAVATANQFITFHLYTPH